MAFIKQNPLPGSRSLIAEAQGLELLRQTLAPLDRPLLRIPEVISVSAGQLQLEQIQSCSGSPSLMAQLGEGLAALHRIPGKQYGLAEENYIGLNSQPNGWSNDWGQFFVVQRLGYQLGLIRDTAIRRQFSQQLQACEQVLIAFLNRHSDQASLLHGDLWSGNVLFDRQDVWLIDPAVYYGDREADIAMTELFGGFSADFYRAYDAAFPRSQVYPAKRTIYNLYHNLNHYNLFGSGYLAACQRGFAQLPQLVADGSAAG